MQNRDQKRAQVAFKHLEAVARERQDFQEKYNTRCRQMPSLIHRCGLCQAVAFYQAKADGQSNKAEARAYFEYLKHFSTAVLMDEASEGARTAEALAKKSRELGFSEYQWLTRHAIECATWFKRYAEALLGDAPEERS